MKVWERAGWVLTLRERSSGHFTVQLHHNDWLVMQRDTTDAFVAKECANELAEGLRLSVRRAA